MSERCSLEVDARTAGRERALLGLGLLSCVGFTSPALADSSSPRVEAASADAAPSTDSGQARPLELVPDPSPDRPSALESGRPRLTAPAVLMASSALPLVASAFFYAVANICPSLGGDPDCEPDPVYQNLGHAFVGIGVGALGVGLVLLAVRLQQRFLWDSERSMSLAPTVERGGGGLVLFGRF